MFGILYAIIAVAAAILLCVIGYQIHNIATKIFHGDGIGVGKIVIIGFVVLAIFAIAALSPAGSRGEEAESKWQQVVVDSSTKVEYDGKTAYLIEFTTNSGEIMSYYDDNNLPKGTELEVFIDNDKVLNSVTKQEEETQAWIIYGALGLLLVAILISIVDGTF